MSHYTFTPAILSHHTISIPQLEVRVRVQFLLLPQKKKTSHYYNPLKETRVRYGSVLDTSIEQLFFKIYF
jgi:hypothetical protein